MTPFTVHIINNPAPPPPRRSRDYKPGKDERRRPYTASRGNELYPFGAMAVGEAFDAPRDMDWPCGLDGRHNSVATSARLWLRRNRERDGIRFVVRCINCTTVRCWRIA